MTHERVTLAEFLAMLAIMTVIVAPLAYGLDLAFNVSIVFGLVALFFVPIPFVLAIAAWLGHPEVAERVASLLGLAG